MPLDTVIFETRKADHIDKRRVLASAFNGDFEAVYAGAFVPPGEISFFC